MEVYLGIDVGSVTTKLAVWTRADNFISHVYLPTRGKPIEMVQEGLRRVKRSARDTTIAGVGTTGSARYLAESLSAPICQERDYLPCRGDLVAGARRATIIEIGRQTADNCHPRRHVV